MNTRRHLWITMVYSGTRRPADQSMVTPLRMRMRRWPCVSMLAAPKTALIYQGIAGYSFFDSAEVELLGRKKSPYSGVGKVIQLAEY